MVVRTARTAWNGTLQEGSGQVELSSSEVGTFDVSLPRRTADDADGTTSPEELVAAAHSSCLSMALAHEIARAGGTPQSLEVSADVTLGQRDGAPTITRIALTVRGEVEGLDATGFEQAARAAKAGCAVSRALAGVDDITLDAALESCRVATARALAAVPRSPPQHSRRQGAPARDTRLPGPRLSPPPRPSASREGTSVRLERETAIVHGGGRPTGSAVAQPSPP
ncbi:OsmC family peroxiredoxin [Geodermatophilus sp. SYSU D00697]